MPGKGGGGGSYRRVQSLWEIHIFGVNSYSNHHIFATTGATGMMLVLMYSLTILQYFEFLLNPYHLVWLIKYQFLCCELPIYALNAVVMSAKYPKK